jgi:hypothetical protein
MNWRTGISLKRIVLLLFIIASFYWWVLIPIVRETLYFTAGPDIAASVSTSLFVLVPTDVLILEPERVPSNLWAFLLYCIKPMGELVAFLSTFLAVFYIRQRVNGFTRCFIYVGIICAATISLSFLRGDWRYGLFPFFASLSGIGVAKFFLRCSPSNIQEQRPCRN